MTNGERDLFSLKMSVTIQHKNDSGETYQFVTDKYKACVLLLLSLLGDETEKSLLRLVVRAIGYPKDDSFKFW